MHHHTPRKGCEVAKAFFTLILFGWLCTGLAQIPVSPNIAVLDLTAKGVDSVDASVLSDKMRGEFINSKKFQVIERGAVDEVLKEQGFQQSDCMSNECVAEAGQLLGVKYMVAGSIGKIEETYLLSVRLINATNGKIEASSQKEISGSLVQMLKTGVPEVVERICDQIAGNGPPALLFSEKEKPAEQKPAVGETPSPPAMTKTMPEKRKNLAVSFSLGSSGGPLELSIADTNGNPVYDSAYYRTVGINGSIELLAGSGSIGLHLSLGASSEITLRNSGHTFQRIMAGLNVRYYYEGLTLFHNSLMFAPGIGAGFWRLTDKGTWADEPGKEATIDFTRFVSPLFKVQTAYPKLNFLVEYSPLFGAAVSKNPVRWIHSDGQEDYLEGKYTIGLVHLVSAGLRYTL
jgi:TolB-like protein